MQLVFGLLILCLAAVVQAATMSELPGGPRPDLVLLLVLAWSMLRGVSEGTIGGLAGGLALDLLSAAPFGLHTGLLALVGSVTALGEANLFRGNLPLFVLAAAVATLAFHGSSVLVLQAAGFQTTGPVQFIQFVVPTAMLNAVLMPLIFVLVQRFVRALDGWRQLEL